MDNRKENLRLCNNQQNNCNRGSVSNSTSKYKGVHKKDKYWHSHIKYNNKFYFLGSYNSEEHATIAYNIKARELFQEFAYLNKVNENIIPNRIKKSVAEKKSNYRGVNWDKRGKKWVVKVYHKKYYYVGLFINEKEAALAYDKKAKELLGDKAKLNFPEKDSNDR